jgi:AraC-like DNA-binding protein
VAVRSRSTIAGDYQHVPRPLAAMARSLEHGHRIDFHDHVRDQLLYAVEGTMRIETADDMWTVPPDRAVYLPAGTVHAVAMRGRVEMRTLYIAPDAGTGLPRQVTALHVGGLLRELILALLEEPVDYETAGRGGLLAALIFEEIRRAPTMELSVPMPRDGRLVGLCQAVLAEPGSNRSIEEWSDLVGASSRTMSRLFSRELKMSFNQWRRRVRFYAAVEHLAAGTQISQVAALLGYSSPSAFTASFRREIGVPPKSFVKAG